MYLLLYSCNVLCFNGAIWLDEAFSGVLMHRCRDDCTITKINKLVTGNEPENVKEPHNHVFHCVVTAFNKNKMHWGTYRANTAIYSRVSRFWHIFLPKKKENFLTFPS